MKKNCETKETVVFLVIYFLNEKNYNIFFMIPFHWTAFPVDNQVLVKKCFFFSFFYEDNFPFWCIT